MTATLRRGFFISYFGNEKRNSSPPARPIFTEIVPPWIRTAFLTMASPNPVPPNFRDLPLSTR